MTSNNGFLLGIDSVHKPIPNGIEIPLNSGDHYKIWMTNTRETVCDATVSIDGKSAGIWRLNYLSTACIECPSNTSDMFIFHGTPINVEVKFDPANPTKIPEKCLACPQWHDGHCYGNGMDHLPYGMPSIDENLNIVVLSNKEYSLTNDCLDSSFVFRDTILNPPSHSTHFPFYMMTKQRDDFVLLQIVKETMNITGEPIIKTAKLNINDQIDRENVTTLTLRLVPISSDTISHVKIAFTP